MDNTALEQSQTRGNTITQKHHWARKVVFALLEKLTVGNLNLHENGQTFQFGENPKTASLSCNVTIRHHDAYLSLIQQGEVGAGEAFMQGHWDTPDLVNVIRLISRNMNVLEDIDNKQPLWRRFLANLYHRYQNNSLKGARRNISAHYDLSNDFFNLFLDKTMAYSSGIYKNTDDTLEQASLNKFQRICEQLELNQQDHLVEIGTGWGGLAIYAAKNYGCRVTSITLSHEQYQHACKWIEQEGLTEQITVMEKDYRDMAGKFTKLVSVEMIEAVGAEYYPTYFRTCSDLLTDDGLMLIQAITISDQRYVESIKATDFIKSYIFPGGQLPSNHVISRHIDQHTNMQLIDLEDITASYALTLKAWRENFWGNIDKIRALDFNEEFIRMWHYYLCFCEGGFRERVIHTAQFLAAKPGYRQL